MLRRPRSQRDHLRLRRQLALTQSNVAGTYSATRLETVTGGVTTDQLAAGATLTLALAANGSVTGRRSVPNGDEGGGNLDESMAGTWVLSGGSVTFSQTADTFVRKHHVHRHVGQADGVK